MSSYSELREGWYLATDSVGQRQLIRRRAGLWIGRTDWPDLARPSLLPGWTLGARLDDLMRDAARYRWLRDHCYRAYVPETYNSATPSGRIMSAQEFDSEIDAEIAKLIV